ncbi:hypothetical protein Dimus_032065 [Dionaea muscipula]
MLHSPVQVVEEFISYYKRLLGSSMIISGFEEDMVKRGALLSAAAVQGLTMLVGDNEVKQALWSIGDTKAPARTGSRPSSISTPGIPLGLFSLKRLATTS